MISHIFKFTYHVYITCCSVGKILFFLLICRKAFKSTCILLAGILKSTLFKFYPSSLIVVFGLLNGTLDDKKQK